MRVLLVAESPESIRLALDALDPARAPGLRVRHMRTLDEAARDLGAGGSDVVALDHGLIGAPGGDALQRLHAADPAAALVVVERGDGPALTPRLFHDGAEDVIVLDESVRGSLGRSLRHALERHRIHGALRLQAAALAVERAAARAENLTVLARVSGLITSVTDTREVLEAVTRAAIALLGAKSAWVLVDDPAAGRLRVAASQTDLDTRFRPTLSFEMPHGRGLAGAAHATHAPIFVEDIAEDPRWLNPGSPEARDLYAYAALPLVARGRGIGVLCILFGERRVFGDEERELMRLLADQAAVAMDNARLLQETERRRRTAEALADVARLITQSLDTAEVAARITESVRSLLGVTNTALFRFRPATNDLESLSLVGNHGPTGGQPIVYPVGSGAAGLAVQDKRPVVTSDLLNDPRIPQPPEQRARMERAPFRAIIAVPLLVQGRVVGALVLGDRVGREFTAEEVGIVEAFADRAAVALDTARLYAEVRDARDFLQSIAESSVDAIVTTDVAGHITYWSPGAQETFGYPASEVLGRPVSDFNAGGVEEARGVMERLQTEGRLRDYEAVIRARDGRDLTVSASFSLLRDAAGAITGTVAVVKDVTERKTLEESLRQAQKMEAVGRLAGGIAHDFNNLMTVAIGRSELLLARLRADDPMRRDVELLRKTAGRAAQLTRQLLAFSRKQVLQPKVVDLNAIVNDLTPMLQRLIGETVELRAVLSPGLGRVQADPGQLEQVLVNLAVNSRDAMAQGGPLVFETANVVLDEIYARKHPGVSPGPHVMLAVSDTGTGMDEATQARIFEPFFTTKEQGKGTGLGLSMVYGIVKQSGGSIWVYSERGHGTTFKIYFPRVDQAPEEADVGAVLEGMPVGTEIVLLVEDEPELRELVRETLEACGYTVLEAGHGAEALDVAAGYGGPIQLLLTDVVMPTMNGADLARALMPRHPAMAVLFMSGYTDDAISHHGVLDPGTAFLEKPFNPAQLARRVREVLDTRPR